MSAAINNYSKRQKNWRLLFADTHGVNESERMCEALKIIIKGEELMSFSGCHPLTIFIYFCVVITASAVARNPVFLFLSLLFSFVYRCIRQKNIKFVRGMIFYLSLIAFFTLLIPMFSHNGKTALFFVDNNAITAEAIFLGLCVGLKISSVLCWIGCMADLLTSEMIIFLISRISPRFAAFFSRMVRFIPMIKRQFHSIYRSQMSIHPGIKNYRKRFRLGAKSISGLLNWLTDNSADMSDSMYARGYGLSGRKSSESYRFRYTDRYIISFIAFTLLITALRAVLKNDRILYYPETVFPDSSVILVLIYIIWSVLMLMPYLTEICEEYRWKLLRSKI